MVAAELTLSVVLLIERGGAMDALGDSVSLRYSNEPFRLKRD